MTDPVVNAAENPVQPSQKILDSADATYGKRLVTGIYTVAGGLVTVTLPDHQIVTGTSVIVAGAVDAGINGTYVITVVNVNSFTYTPAAPPANPLALAVVPLPGEILVGQVHVSAIFRMASVVAVFVVGSTVNVQTKTNRYQPWVNIGAALVANGVVEFPVPYNFVRAVQTLPVAGVVSAHAQGVYAQSLAGSPI